METHNRSFGAQRIQPTQLGGTERLPVNVVLLVQYKGVVIWPGGGGGMFLRNNKNNKSFPAQQHKFLPIALAVDDR